MSVSYFIWGLVAIVAGSFFCIYGYTLFRFVLAAFGFLTGYSLAMGLTESQPEFIRLIIGVVAGGLGAGLLYYLYSVSMYIAGAILGFVVSLLLTSLLLVMRVDNAVLSIILVLVGLGLGAWFGRNLGELIIILATSAMGAYVIVYGFVLFFSDSFGVEPEMLGGRIPLSWETIVLLLAFGIISGLAQYQILTLRRRVRGTA